MTQDETLDDILLEMKSPSLIKPSKTSNSIVLSRTKKTDFTKTKPLTKRTSGMNVRCDKVSDMEMVKDKGKDILDDWTKDDDIYFSKLGVEVGIKNKDKENVRAIDDDIEIGHFLTPCDQATKGSRSSPVEMEIEEYFTQKDDSKQICDKMEGLTPFKKKM